MRANLIRTGHLHFMSDEECQSSDVFDVFVFALVPAGNILSYHPETTLNLMLILVVGKIGRAGTAACGTPKIKAKSKKQKVKRIQF